MSENTTNVNANAAETAQAAPSEADLKAMYDALPDMFKEAIDKINAAIDEHNKNVDKIKAAGTQDTNLIKAEIFEQNPGNNKKLAALRKEYDKLIEAQEKLISQAYKVIDDDGLMPENLTEEQVTKLKTEVTANAKSLKDQVSAMAQFEVMMPMLKGKVLPLVHEIKTQRGTAKTGTSSGSKGDGPKRPRFKRIEINGVVADDKGNTVYGVVNGEEKFTFSLASAYLRKQHKGINWTANDLQSAYFGDKTDQSELPETHTFVMPYTYKADNGTEHTVTYEVKCVR
ncbi:hypothetical protein [Streptomyces anandii]|uniref:hypothetical protein n=1 Tax=Streptomyces anandii TaxID=285454 RepID=UPI0036763D72